MESRTWPYLAAYNEDSASPLMTVPEPAEYLCAGRNAVYRLLQNGLIHSGKFFEYSVIYLNRSDSILSAAAIIFPAASKYQTFLLPASTLQGTHNN